MTVVVDASALVELLARGPGAPFIEKVLGSEPAFAPELLDVEVLSALARLERLRQQTRARTARALALLASAPIRRVPHLPLVERAWSLRQNLSLYDAMYVALAAAMDCALLTADGRLAQAPGSGVAVLLVPDA